MISLTILNLLLVPTGPFLAVTKPGTPQTGSAIPVARSSTETCPEQQRKNELRAEYFGLDKLSPEDKIALLEIAASVLAGQIQRCSTQSSEEDLLVYQIFPLYVPDAELRSTQRLIGCASDRLSKGETYDMRDFPLAVDAMDEPSITSFTEKLIASVSAGTLKPDVLYVSGYLRRLYADYFCDHLDKLGKLAAVERIIGHVYHTGDQDMHSKTQELKALKLAVEYEQLLIGYTPPTAQEIQQIVNTRQKIWHIHCSHCVIQRQLLVRTIVL